jgi:hypothetical protein
LASRHEPRRPLFTAEICTPTLPVGAVPLEDRPRCRRPRETSISHQEDLPVRGP